jgi:hypothetical protein
VDTDIDERTAALLLFVDKHAPAGDAASAQGVGTRVVNLAQIALLLNIFIQELGDPRESPLECDLQDFATAPCR